MGIHHPSIQKALSLTDMLRDGALSAGRAAQGARLAGGGVGHTEPFEPWKPAGRAGLLHPGCKA